MPTHDYNPIIIGGGVAGSPLTAIAGLPQRITPCPRAKPPQNAQNFGSVYKGYQALPTCDYDLIIIGGGVAGSALAAGIAAAGARTLVLEAETSFRDRVRGEAIMPWGVAEARQMGLLDVITQAGANPLPFWDSYQGADRSGHRDLTRTTQPKEPALACYHPALQTALLNHAESRGGEVWRTVS